MTQEEIQGWSALRQEVEETRRLLTHLERHVQVRSPDERTINILAARMNLVPATATTG
jgi:hypothetical protein